MALLGSWRMRSGPVDTYSVDGHCSVRFMAESGHTCYEIRALFSRV